MISYHEPDIIQLLVLSSFLVLLQVSRHALDWLLSAGLLGELLLGCLYGSPVGGLLTSSWELTFLVLGYLGLILIVFQGGLEINLPVFYAQLALSTLCALVGCLLPILLSLLLLHVAYGYTLLEAFVAGSALSSTSLGTTFFVLQQLQGRAGESAHGNTNIGATKVAMVLMSAALLDDVVALVLLSVIQQLGSDTALGWTIGRPLTASAALAVGVPALTVLLLRLVRVSNKGKGSKQYLLTASQYYHLILALMVVTLTGLVTAAYYAGSSMLLGAFLGGFVVQQVTSTLLPATPCVHEVYASAIEPTVTYVLAPLFFASIGYGTSCFVLAAAGHRLHGD